MTIISTISHYMIGIYKWYPKYYYDFVSCIEVLNHVDKKIGRKAIEKLVKHLKPHNSTWAHYIVSTYLNRNIRY